MVMAKDAMSTLGKPSHLATRTREMPLHWRGSLITTDGFLSFVGLGADKTLTTSLLTMHVGYLRNCASLALEMLSTAELLNCPPALQLSCRRDGCVDGFTTWVSALPAQAVPALHSDWKDL
jgi:hypothetical protein